MFWSRSMVLNPPEDFSEGLLALDVKRVSELDVVDLVLGLLCVLDIVSGGLSDCLITAIAFQIKEPPRLTIILILSIDYLRLCALCSA